MEFCTEHPDELTKVAAVQKKVRVPTKLPLVVSCIWDRTASCVEHLQWMPMLVDQAELQTMLLEGHGTDTGQAVDLISWRVG